jgi:P4 family phage/plasmid primase-like protien
VSARHSAPLEQTLNSEWQPQNGSDHQQNGSLDEHAKEHELAALLEGFLPPIRCVGRDWYRYENGVWRRGTKDIFRPMALAIQHSRSRTDRMAGNVLGHLESKFQAAEETFCSFCKFDAGAILINCANGVLRIRRDSEQLLLHSPDYFFSGQVAAGFDAEAEAPTFGKVLADALPDPDDLALFRLFVGYTLYPGCPFEAALVCYGDGGTGKSTIADGVRAALGDDLVRSLSLVQICDPKSFHLVNLRNAAVNICTELDALPIMSADNFKLLVSGEQVSADRKHQELISLKTSCKFLFLTNYLPRFQHGTDAELRRLRFLRFEKRPAKPDPTLKQRIALEQDGVFRFAIDGLRNLLATQEISQGGRQSLETRERFKIQNDPIAAFVRECCRVDPEAEVLKNQLYHEYKEYLSTNGLPDPANESPFFRALYNRFPVKELRRRDGSQLIRKLAGIELRSE